MQVNFFPSNDYHLINPPRKFDLGAASSWLQLLHLLCSYLMDDFPFDSYISAFIGFVLVFPFCSYCTCLVFLSYIYSTVSVSLVFLHLSWSWLMDDLSLTGLSNPSNIKTFACNLSLTCSNVATASGFSVDKTKKFS